MDQIITARLATFEQERNHVQWRNATLHSADNRCWPISLRQRGVCHGFIKVLTVRQQWNGIVCVWHTKADGPQ